MAMSGMAIAGVVIGLVFALGISAYFIAAIYPNSLGTIANSSSGNAMKNVDAGTKSLYNLFPLVLVIGPLMAIVGVALFSMHQKGKI